MRVKNNQVYLCCNKKGHCFSTLNSWNVTVNSKWTIGLVDCQIDLEKIILNVFYELTGLEKNCEHSKM